MTEKDFLEAKLVHKTSEKHNIVQLKTWLNWKHQLTKGKVKTWWKCQKFKLFILEVTLYQQNSF